MSNQQLEKNLIKLKFNLSKFLESFLKAPKKKILCTFEHQEENVWETRNYLNDYSGLIDHIRLMRKTNSEK